MKKFYSLLLFVLVAAASAIAGPITSNAVTGNWNSTSTWVGGVVPAAGDDVIIVPGASITVTADATVNSITFSNTATTARTLTVNSGITLTVTNAITLQNGTSSNTSATIAGSGNISCASFTVGGTSIPLSGGGTSTLTFTTANLSVSGNLSAVGLNNSGNTNNVTFNLQSGKISVGGSVVLNRPAGTVNFTMASGAQTGTLDIAGSPAFSITGTPTFTANATSSTVIYSGAAQTVNPVTYRNLTLSGSGTKTMTSVSTINGSFTLTGTASATAATALTIGSGVDIESGATFNGSTFSHSVSGDWTNNGGTYTASTGTVTFAGTGTIGGSSTSTFNNLTISGSSNTVTLAVNTLVSGNLTVSDNFNLSTFSCNRTAAGGTLSVTGTMRLAGNAGGQTGSNFPTNFNTVTLSGTVEYNGSNAITQTIYATPTYANLTLTNGTGSGSAAKISTGNLTINTTFTVNANTVFTPGAANTVGGSSNTITGSGKIDVTRTAATASYTGQYTFSTNTLTSMTVEYSGAGNQTISANNCTNLITSGSGTKTMSGSMTVSANTTIGAGTTLDEAAITLTLGSGSVVTVNGTLDFSNTTGLIRTGNNLAATLTMGSTGLIKTADATGLGPVAGASLQVQGTGSWTTTSIDNNGTVEYYAGVAQALTDRNYNNLTISTTAGTKTWTLAATRTVNGTLTISANAPFTFAGGVQTLNLKGDWINNSTGAFTPASVKINLNGSAVQTIDGLVETKFGALTFNNAAGFSLDNNVTVNGVMTLTNGIVSASSNVLTISATGSVTGASDASFIDGKVKKTGAIGGTAFEYPVGKTGVGYMKISIANVTGATTEFTAQYIRSSASNDLGTTGLTALGIQAVSNCEYWTLDRAITASDADVTLSWNAHSPCGSGAYLVDPLFGIRVVHYNTSTLQWDAHGGGSPSGDASAGSVTWTGVSNFSPFALGALVGSQNGLPVMFNNVKAYEKNRGVQIDWTNLTERDLIEYVVERSANGVNYTAIGQQTPRGNSNDKESYSAFDASPLSGANYYRVKVLEISGKVIYSKVIRVDIGRTIQGFTLYPNPVKGNQVSVSINTKQGQYTLKVMNTSGQEIYSQRIAHQGGSLTQVVELPSSIKPGVYNMLISGDNYRETKMFVVQ